MNVPHRDEEPPGYLELICPIAPEPVAKEAAAADLPSVRLDGARVSLVDNTKANAIELLDAYQRLLVRDFGAVPGITIHKPVSGALTDDTLAALDKGSELVLVASAD